MIERNCLKYIFYKVHKNSLCVGYNSFFNNTQEMLICTSFCNPFPKKKIMSSLLDMGALKGIGDIHIYVYIFDK